MRMRPNCSSLSFVLKPLRGLLILAVATIVCVPVITFGQDTSSEADPSDLLQAITYLEFSYERQELNYGGLTGGIDILRVEYDMTPFRDNLLVIEGGFANSSVETIGESGLVDTRIRYFNFAKSLGKIEGLGWKRLGFGVEAFLPTGDITKGTGFDTWVVAPSIIAAYQLSPSMRFFPLVAFVYTTPTDAFKDFTGSSDNTQSISVESYVTHSNAGGFYGLWHVGYSFGMSNADNGALIQSRLGQMLSETKTVGVEFQYNTAENEAGDWGKPILGAEWTLRLFYGMYF